MKSFCRNLIAVLCACMIAMPALPVMTVGCAEENMSLTFANGVVDTVPQLTIDEYFNNIDEIIEVWKTYDKNFDQLFYYTYPAYYYINYKYCRDIRPELVKEGIIPEEYDILDSNTMGIDLYLKNSKLLKNKKKTDQLMDIGICILDPETKELVHNVSMNYISSYEKATINCDEYMQLMEELAVLKTRDYVTWSYFHDMLYVFYEHCILQNFKQKDIKEYFATNGKELEPDKTNSKKYKNSLTLIDELKSKQDKTELEQYIELFLGISVGSIKNEDIDEYVQGMNCDYFIDTVKSGHPDLYPDITFEDAFNKYYEKSQWKTTGESIVVFDGECVYKDKSIKIELHFRMNNDNTFTLFKGRVYRGGTDIPLYWLYESQDLAPFVYDPFTSYQ